MVTETSLMKLALGEAWERLPPALQAHYQAQPNRDVGALDIEYPRAMQLYLDVLRQLGALVNRRGSAVPTVVEKRIQGGIQYWKRVIRFEDGAYVRFESRWVYGGGSRLIEYVNPVIGLCMEVHVEKGRLHYEGRHFVVKLGPLRLPVPEWLVLGHTTIVETALDDGRFAMDFRLRHPVFGQVYRYSGVFRTQAIASTGRQ
ncbi:MAG TPA: DUF4166 domain-containing protein [Gammaproteobacteria bacterium]|nr:DUF4166 domain-containing protein [Gammaproteobacteria bacterium]